MKKALVVVSMTVALYMSPITAQILGSEETVRIEIQSSIGGRILRPLMSEAALV